jgi:hypothetical protein
MIDRDGTRASGILSYLLFDGGFARWLIELGRHDARVHHAGLVALFGEAGAISDFG